jgi:hypothetical protein
MWVQKAGTAMAHRLVKVGEASHDSLPKYLSIIPPLALFSFKLSEDEKLRHDVWGVACCEVRDFDTWHPTLLNERMRMDMDIILFILVSLFR